MVPAVTTYLDVNFDAEELQSVSKGIIGKDALDLPAVASSYSVR
jgi:hypothetical protein